MKSCWKDDEDMCEKVAVLEAEINRITKENAGLKEYSESRDESIKVYRAEIKELNELLDEIAKKLAVEEIENNEFRERLKGIEEVYYIYQDKKNTDYPTIDIERMRDNKAWQAIKKACEVKE